MTTITPRIWHRFWAALFQRRVPTSGNRAHIGNLVIRVRDPKLTIADFGRGWSTDARKVIIIGDLMVFDYGETPIQVLTPEFRPAPRDLGPYDDLLAENKRHYPL